MNRPLTTPFTNSPHYRRAPRTIPASVAMTLGAALFALALAVLS